MSIQRSTDTEFRLTEDHIKLLRRMIVNWNTCETGAPEIDPKRPYGNSYVAGDVAEILGREDVLIETEDGDHEYPEWAESEWLDIHRETELALQIVLSTGSFEPGLYRRQRQYSREWERA